MDTFFSGVYDILVAVCGAHEVYRASFVMAHTAVPACKEWRIEGCLGFGGKYRSGSNSVDCYPEDETEDRKKIISRANAALAKLGRDAATRVS